MKKITSILLLLFALSLLLAPDTATAQTENSSAADEEIGQPLVIRSDGGITAVVPSMFEPITTGGLLDNTLVKNKPLTADFESETVRILANGTSTRRRVTTKIYRDKDGRTRREQIVYPNGTVPAAATTAPIISIFDPVALYSYSINPQARTAERQKLPLTLPLGAPLDNKIPLSIEVFRNDNSQGGAAQKYTLEKPLLEPLGKQTITGVTADGWRITIKIPAGALGNGGPVESVYEMWFALDLGMMVKFVARNPVSGEQTLLLKSISRTEQSRTLFEVPAGYAVSEMGTRRTDLAPPH